MGLCVSQEVHWWAAHSICRMGGTAGAIITCPLEVVKTRLQATDSGFGSNPPPPSKSETLSSKKAAVGSTTNTSTSGSIRNSIFHPEVARGHMQITVPVASMHSKASISSEVEQQGSTKFPIIDHYKLLLFRYLLESIIK